VQTALPVYAPQTEPISNEKPARKATDWGTLFLWLFASAAMLGLIPFWLYVYLTLKP
jgi:hypothetical protein